MSYTSDHDGDIAPIVDCDVLEAAKENIQPLASGRRVTTLSAIFSTPHAQRDAQLTATRAEHRATVDAALENRDLQAALAAFVEFVGWTIEHYPQGHSAESGILELLEEATRTLKDDEACRADARYLKLWVLYASYVERPAVIYAFLLANDIGTAHAMLYEEYALVLERDGRRTEADEIYLLGIARRVAPLDHLQNRHRDFQKRMMSSLTNANAIVPAPPPSSAAPQRTVLGTTSTKSSRSSGSRRIQVFNDPASEDVFSGVLPPPSSSASSLATSSSTSSTRAKPNAKMQIFIDPTGEDAGSADGNAWPDIGTRKTRIKENVPETKKFAGTTLRQCPPRATAPRAASSSASGIVPFRDPEPAPAAMRPPPPPTHEKTIVVLKTPAKPAFVPFCDDDTGGAESPEVPATPSFKPFRDESDSMSPSAPVPGFVMRQKGTRAASEAEALRKDPFKNYQEKEATDL